MTTFETGRRAELAAAAFLERKGCKIIERNWRTRLCEIDIIVRRRDVIYFCEVKYRRTLKQGSGMEYITLKKVRQMGFAAESWVHAHGWTGEYQLCAVEVSGPAFQVTAAVKDITASV